jgi:signal transduction histidine kinase
MAAASVAEVLERFHVWDDEGRPVGPQALPGRLAQDGEPVERVLRFRAAGTEDGDRWALVRAIPIREGDGEVGRVVNVFSDVTERRLVERWQRFLGEASGALAASGDLGALLQALSAMAVRSIADACVVELRRPDGLVRTVARAVAEPEVAARLGPADLDGASLLRDGASRLLASAADELPELAARGVESALSVPLAARGEVIGALTLLTAGRLARYRAADLIAAEDLARRVSITIENLRLHGESREALRAREDLLAIVSHDLRNPLGVVLASSALLLKSSLPTEKEQRARRQVEAIQRAGHRMNRLIRDLLDFASIQGGRLTINPRTQNAADLLAEVVAVLEPLAAEKSLRIENEAAGRQVPVTCDHDRMIQALSNVVGNAIKFTADGGSIRVGAEPDERGGARLSVTDTGPGIAADEVPHVFDRYFQASRKNREGIGLGLSIAKGIVDAHGGHISVESQEGRGSTFTISLPAPVEEAR